MRSTFWFSVDSTLYLRHSYIILYTDPVVFKLSDPSGGNRGGSGIHIHIEDSVLNALLENVPWTDVLESLNNKLSRTEETKHIREHIYKTALDKAQCLKIIQNVAFEFLNFGIFHQFLSYFKTNLSGNTV